MTAPTVRLRRLASELRRLRQEAELTREDVAERTGIDRATLYRIESAGDHRRSKQSGLTGDTDLTSESDIACLIFMS